MEWERETDGGRADLREQRLREGPGRSPQAKDFEGVAFLLFRAAWSRSAPECPLGLRERGGEVGLLN